MAAIDINLLAQLSAEGMAECLVEGILLACIAASILRLANVKDAATRFAVWMSTLLTMAILPFGTAVWRLQASGATVGAGADPAAVHLGAQWPTTGDHRPRTGDGIALAHCALERRPRHPLAH